MKAFKYLLFVMAGILIFVACQKELSFESGFSGGRGKGSLFTVGGSCQPVTVGGYYLKDSTLTDSNYVIVTLNVTNPGTYNISTETKNGFSFSDSGYFIRTGPQTLKLKAIGKPLVIQQTLFTVTFDTSFCAFAVDVSDTIIKPAAYTFTKSTPTVTCMGENVLGLYKVGVPLNSSNRVDDSVVVTAPGRYSITTDTIHGIWFRAAGIVYGSGYKTITFQGYGKPDSSAAGIHTFTTKNSDGTAACSFKIRVDTGTIVNPPGPTSDSAWIFSAGGITLHGPIDTAIFTSTPLGSFLSITGPTAPGGDSSITLNMTMPGATIQPGTYATNTGFTNAFSFDDGSGNNIYSANIGTTTVSVTMTITSYDSATKIVKGTFSGTAEDGSGGSVNITGGKFEAKVP